MLCKSSRLTCNLHVQSHNTPPLDGFINHFKQKQKKRRLKIYLKNNLLFYKLKKKQLII